MKLDILNTYDHGGDRERVTLVANDAVNLGSYLIVGISHLSNNQTPLETKDVYFFPNMEVKTNEWVRLFTGLGAYFVSKELRGNTMKVIHNLYWNLDHTIWNASGDEVYLLNIADGVVKKISKE
jgi:hypothetical protein